MKRIGCSKRNCTFCNKRTCHNNIGNNSAAFRFCKFLREELAGKCNTKRRNHAAGHDRCHCNIACLNGGIRVGCAGTDHGSCLGKCTGTKYIGCLVDGATHIDCHHSTQNQSHKSQHACIGESSKHSAQTCIYKADQWIQNKAHYNAYDKNTAKRINQHGFNSIQRFWHTGA